MALTPIEPMGQATAIYRKLWKLFYPQSYTQRNSITANIIYSKLAEIAICFYIFVHYAI